MITAVDVASMGSVGDDEQRRRLVRDGVEAFRRDGCLLLERVFDVALIDELQAAFERRHGANGAPRGSLRVGHQRYMITLRLSQPFTDARLYGNETLRAIVDEVLGADWMLFSFGAVVSYPGAEDQHVHSDGGGLFGDADVEGRLPPYAITTIVPLVDMNDETGTTRVWPGSHRSGDDDGSIEAHDPLVARGSALLMDYRLRHGGRGNRSSMERPILSLVLARPWFRDSVNFDQQEPLAYDAADRRRMPPELATRLPPDTRRMSSGRRLGARLRSRLSRS